MLDGIVRLRCLRYNLFSNSSFKILTPDLHAHTHRPRPTATALLSYILQPAQITAHTATNTFL